MTMPNAMDSRAKLRGPSLDLALVARRAVVAIAALAGLLGILAERPVLWVALRAGAVAVIGLCAIHVAQRVTARVQASMPRRARGGTR